VSPSRIRLVNVIDLGDGTGGRECRIAVINRKKCSASPITTISVEGLPERIFMLDMGAEPNLIKDQKLSEIYIQTRKSQGR